MFANKYDKIKYTMKETNGLTTDSYQLGEYEFAEAGKGRMRMIALEAAMQSRQSQADIDGISYTLEDVMMDAEKIMKIYFKS